MRYFLLIFFDSLNDRHNKENPCDFAYCGENSVCTPCLDDLCNYERNFQCSCKPGFALGSKTKNHEEIFFTKKFNNFEPKIENFEIGSNICIDINECMQPEIRCQENAECVNTEGSYSCACKEGFYEDENGNCQGFLTHSRL